ncbi:hypothetical protein [Flavobacterium sp. '19STA2R22 D10 B1']|uniref:hypothetical protein n=1 Tax=Flavobacterium aerium TaxID=3037261 RepID=UPI00278BDF72|nr:hypothetical protein [Flavobacterium sp. '19STA2R22 D10 B1']
MKTYSTILIILCFFINSYSQEKNECSIINEDFEYFEITIFTDNVEPLFFNVIGKNINFSNYCNESLKKFIDDLYHHNYFVPSFITNRAYYFKNCNSIKIDSKEDLIFIGKLNGSIKKLSKKNILDFYLKSGEKISIKGIKLNGSFIKYNIKLTTIENISFYPNEIYECKNIKDYIVPFKIEHFSKLKNCQIKKKI